MTRTSFTKLRVRGERLPELARWADGQMVSVPAWLADALNNGGSFVERDVCEKAERAAGLLRMAAAFTPDAPASARLPINYRAVPGPARRAIARGAGLLQRLRQDSWSRFPVWPIDLSADLASDLAGTPTLTFTPTPVLLTHDIDSAEGLENLVRLFLPIEEGAGARSTNFIVPCAWPLDHSLIAEAKHRGHEIGVHGYDHANRTPFADQAERQRRLAAGRAFGDRYCASGYRAPSLLRTAELLADLAPLYRYDTSIPTSGGPFPVPNNGCASARPWRLGRLWEIPLTLPRDGSLRFLGHTPSAIEQLWKDVALVVSRSGGVVSLLTHCEAGFSGNPRMLAAYRDFVEWIGADVRFEFRRAADLLDRLGASESAKHEA